MSREEFNQCLELLSRDYKSGSWNTYISCIRVWYKWYNGEEYPDSVKHIHLKKLCREDYVKTKILSEAEIKALLQACEHPRDKAFIAVAAAT